MPTISLKPHEYLRLWRYKMGITAKYMGERYDVLPSQWCAWERGEGVPPKRAVQSAIRYFKTHAISVAEYCRVLRERNNLLQADVAKELGVSHVTVCHMETGRVCPERLVSYWKLPEGVWFALND